MMFRFTKGTNATIICTLAEKQTIVDANFLFVFTSRMTNETISFVLVSAADLSTNKTRWNEFLITVNTYFINYSDGWYTYDVYEQESTTNTDITGLNRLESGVMYLTDSTTVTTTEYSQSVNFKMYDAG